MIIRNAKVSDVKEINSIISDFAGLDRMLFRSMANIYENIQTFTVAEHEGRVVGCVALSVMWADLAEVKSLAVSREMNGKGVGRKLVDRAVQQAKELGINRFLPSLSSRCFLKRWGFHALTAKSCR